MRVEVLLAVERRAVDPGELRLRRVAAPVRAGEAGELQRLDRLRVLEVRAAAEIGEVTLRVERDVALGGVDELDLVRLALGGEARLRLVARDLLARPLAALLQLARDLGLDLLEVLLAESARGSRSRSRSRSRSAARSRSSRPDRGVAQPRRAGAPTSGEGRRARRGRSCRASSGSGSAARPRAAGAGPARSRSRGRAPPARRASARSRARRRGRSRRPEVQARSCRVARPSCQNRIWNSRAKTIATTKLDESPVPDPEDADSDADDVPTAD